MMERRRLKQLRCIARRLPHTPVAACEVTEARIREKINQSCLPSSMRFPCCASVHPGTRVEQISRKEQQRNNGTEAAAGDADRRGKERREGRRRDERTP